MHEAVGPGPVEGVAHARAADADGGEGDFIAGAQFGAAWIDLTAGPLVNQEFGAALIGIGAALGVGYGGAVEAAASHQAGGARLVVEQADADR